MEYSTSRRWSYFLGRVWVQNGRLAGDRVTTFVHYEIDGGEILDRELTDPRSDLASCSLLVVLGLARF